MPLSSDDLAAIRTIVREELAASSHAPTMAAVPTRKFLDSIEAAKYLGFGTRGGIRHLVYSGELVPDGRGPRNCYVFTVENLESWVRTRKKRYEERKWGRAEESPHGVRVEPRETPRRGRAAEESRDNSLAKIREITARAGVRNPGSRRGRRSPSGQ